MSRASKIPVYFIPGMCANGKIFERIKLPKEKYEVFVLEWLSPLVVNENIDSYALRMAQQIKHAYPILVGVSFGGIIAQEISNVIPCRSIFIVSSIKNFSENSRLFKWIWILKIHRYLPIKWLILIEKLIKKFGSKKQKNLLKRFEYYLSIRDPKYIKWAMNAYLSWKNIPLNTPIIHIHGDADTILPIKYIQQCIPVKQGTHGMIVTKPHRIQQIIIEYTVNFT